MRGQLEGRRTRRSADTGLCVSRLDFPFSAVRPRAACAPSEQTLTPQCLPRLCLAVDLRITSSLCCGAERLKRVGGCGCCGCCCCLSACAGWDAATAAALAPFAEGDGGGRPGREERGRRARKGRSSSGREPAVRRAVAGRRGRGGERRRSHRRHSTPPPQGRMQTRLSTPCYTIDGLLLPPLYTARVECCGHTAGEQAAPVRLPKGEAVHGGRPHAHGG